MRPSSKPSSMGRGRGYIDRRGITENVTPFRSNSGVLEQRSTSSYQDIMRCLGEREGEMIRIEAEYRLVTQEALHRASLRENASHIDLILERNGCIIQEISCREVLNREPHPRYAVQRATNINENPAYRDGELRALTIIDEWSQNSVIQHGDRIVLRGSQPSCMDCAYNIERYVRDLRKERGIGITVDMEHTHTAAILDARTRTNPRNSLTQDYGDVRAESQQAPIGGEYWRTRYTPDMADIPPWSAEQLRFRFGAGVPENGSARVYLQRNTNLPRTQTDMEADPSEVLTRFLGRNGSL